jgi:hypothetical protein
MSNDRKGVIIYTDTVISYFDSNKDPHEERYVRQKLRSFRDHFDPTMLDDFEGYKGTSTIKKAKVTRQYRAVFVWLPDVLPYRLIQVIQVFNKNEKSSPSKAFLQQADQNAKKLKKQLQQASEQQLEQIISNLGKETEAERPPK